MFRIYLYKQSMMVMFLLFLKKWDNFTMLNFQQHSWLWEESVLCTLI